MHLSKAAEKRVQHMAWVLEFCLFSVSGMTGGTMGRHQLALQEGALTVKENCTFDFGLVCGGEGGHHCERRIAFQLHCWTSTSLSPLVSLSSTEATKA